METSIGAQIRLLREHRGLTQARLAKLSRTTQQHVSLLERDAAGVELGTLRRLLDSLGYRITFTERPAAAPLAERLGQWARFEARMTGVKQPQQSLAKSLRQVGEMAEMYLSAHGRKDSPGGLKVQASRIDAWRKLLARARNPQT
ncbi:MAG: helix-turn-helix transcriptional regulator [Elusimicrobiota bacterium]